ncbi:MAG: hypothetical protein M3326_08375, partial [Actinomycetota bacterium]|nr:hypothetical protein [Actinomycetota bacterium]
AALGISCSCLAARGVSVEVEQISKRLRLLKVIVQPVFVLDDDEIGLTEHVAQPVEVPAHEWPTYAAERFVSSFRALQQQMESEA